MHTKYKTYVSILVSEAYYYYVVSADLKCNAHSHLQTQRPTRRKEMEEQKDKSVQKWVLLFNRSSKDTLNTKCVVLSVYFRNYLPFYYFLLLQNVYKHTNMHYFSYCALFTILYIIATYIARLLDTLKSSMSLAV